MGVPLNHTEVRRRRELLGLSQSEAAKRCGFSLQRLWNIENGDRLKISPDALYMIAHVLDCPMEALMIPPVDAEKEQKSGGKPKKERKAGRRSS